jgi:hypothetical protein
MSEPLERWSEAAPHSYRLAKGAYAQRAPQAEQLERMLARVEAASPAASLPFWRGPKLWLSILSLALLGAALFLAADAVRPRARVSIPVPRERVSDPPLIVARPAPSAEHSVPSAQSAAPSVARVQPAVASDPLTELALLERARRVMAKDPARALQLTEQHRRQYRTGLLAEERELLAVEALVKLEHKGQAERRARSFEHAHPNSVHLRRLGVILEHSAP